MVSSRFDILRYFVKFLRSGHAKFFSFWNITMCESYPPRRLTINPTNLISWSDLSKEVIWIVSRRFDNLRFFNKFHSSGHAKFFSVWNITMCESYPPRRLTINPTNLISWSDLSKEVIWIVSRRFDNLRFFNKFHSSGHAKFFSFWSITVCESYPSRRL